MSAHVQQASVFSGRSMTFMAVVGLHALMITALIAIKYVPPLIDKGPPPIKVIDVPPEVQPPPPPPQFPKPTEVPRLQMPIPIAPPDIVIPDDALAATATSNPVEETGPVQVATDTGTSVVIDAPPSRVFTDLKYSAIKAPDEFYPATSVSLQEQGVSIINVCVGPNGKIDGVPTVQVSSGSRRLDQAAIRWTREALRFTPATDNGAAVRACKGFRVVFKLN